MTRPLQLRSTQFWAFFGVVTYLLSATPVFAGPSGLEVGTYGSVAMGQGNTLDSYHPGFTVEGYYRFAQHFGGDLQVNYHRLKNPGGSWYLVNFSASWHPIFVEPSEPDNHWLDPYVGLSLGDSIFRNTQGIFVGGKVGSRFWVSSPLGLVLEAQMGRVIGIGALSAPSFTPILFRAGFIWSFGRGEAL